MIWHRLILHLLDPKTARQKRTLHLLKQWSAGRKLPSKKYPRCDTFNGTVAGYSGKTCLEHVLAVQEKYRIVSVVRNTDELASLLIDSSILREKSTSLICSRTSEYWGGWQKRKWAEMTGLQPVIGSAQSSTKDKNQKIWEQLVYRAKLNIPAD